MREWLLPAIGPDKKIVMDRRRLGKWWKRLGVSYSPDLNPIEQVWYRIKQKVRKLQVSPIENLQSLVNETIRSLCQVL
ncbi:MAG: hypothetical protein NZ482_01540 [Gloeomargarita sp. SKYG98]|nr:hypothetical protein [Gloeomargarita sp. SKYG98]